MINFFKKKKEPERIRITDFIYNYISRTRYGKVYKRRYRNICRHIEDFSKKTGIVLYFDNFTAGKAEEFIYYLKSEGRLKDKNKGTELMNNTVKGIWESVKSILNKAKNQKIEINLDVLEINIKREDANAVYLTLEELNRLNSLKLTPSAAAVRDRFLVGCFTALRFSDYSQLTKENIIGNNIEIKTRKTGIKVIIPIHPIIYEILKRNNGDFPNIKSEVAFNKVVKTICKKAGINTNILYERTIGLRVVRKMVKKYELVSSHTARRSGATNMYLAGIPTARIMLLTGHTTEQSFFRYIRIGKEENARTLAEFDFFK